MLSAEQVRALVAAARARGLRVTAHVQGRRGLEVAIAGGVDELAHMPCEDAWPPAGPPTCSSSAATPCGTSTR
jgi:imidazolonepropionase-like amidohydrolase